MKRVVFLAVFLFLLVGMAIVVAAQVNISISVPPPPPLVFPGPPDVVVVPSETSDVYLVPDTVGVYFYGGYWYRFYGDHWFRASVYSGPWISIRGALVPGVVMAIPPDYILGLPPGYHRIHYGDFHGHWREWGRNRHWNRQAWYRDHSQHHWGGREFRRPSSAHGGGDVHGKTDLHRGGDVQRKTDLQRKVDVQRKTEVGRGGEVHRKVDVQRSKVEAPHKQGGQQHEQR